MEVLKSESSFVGVEEFAFAFGNSLRRRKDQTLSGAGEGCFRGLFYEVSLALVGVASPA
jgi:hypothetical protein